MRTIDRVRSRSGRSMMPRVGSLMMLGALVLLLYSYSSEARNWTWLTKETKQTKRVFVTAASQNADPVVPVKKADGPEKAEKAPDSPERPASPEKPNPETPAGPEKPADTEKAAEAPAKADDSSEKKPSDSAAKSPDGSENQPREFEIPNGKPVEGSAFIPDTDQDPEQKIAVREEFQALADGSVAMRREEMPAYWRLFLWTKNQTAKQMLARAETVSLHNLLKKTEEQRGKLIKLELNVRRVMSYDAPENSLGIKTIYELWGWSEESKSWLYVGLTSELTPGMELGPEVYERGTFVGYFLKVQGYHESNSKSNERPLSSPLLIGRFIWQPPAPITTNATEPWWIWAVLGGLAVVVAFACVWPWIRKPPASRPPLSTRPPGEQIALFQNEEAVGEENEEESTNNSSSLPLLGIRGSAELN